VKRSSVVEIWEGKRGGRKESAEVADNFEVRIADGDMEGCRAGGFDCGEGGEVRIHGNEEGNICIARHAGDLQGRSLVAFVFEGEVRGSVFANIIKTMLGLPLSAAQ
jgi:hypothetical protein